MHPMVSWYVADEHAHELHAQADLARRRRQARLRAPDRPAPGWRRALGFRLVEVGLRLASAGSPPPRSWSAR